jgi:hypothetical protein
MPRKGQKHPDGAAFLHAQRAYQALKQFHAMRDTVSRATARPIRGYGFQTILTEVWRQK